MGNTLKIDLWAPPAQSETSVPLEDGRIADPYPQPEISSFFTAVLNVQCTLARYRPNQTVMQKRRRTCVVPKCRLEFPDPSLLAKHYEAHAEDFDKEKRRLAKKEKADRPPALTLAVDGESSGGGLGRSNSRGLFRSASKRKQDGPLSAGLTPSRPYTPVPGPERKSLDFIHKEIGSVGLTPQQHDLQRANSKAKTGGGLLRSLSKRHASNPTPPATSGGVGEKSPPVARKSLDRLHVGLYAPRLGHDRAKSEQVMTTPLINIEDTDSVGLNGGLQPQKGGWVKRHLSVRSTKEKRMLST